MRLVSFLVVTSLAVASWGAQAQASDALVEALRAYAAAEGSPRSQEFRHALSDLNGDGVDDAVVLLLGSDWCGSGGCTLLVLEGGGKGGREAYRFVSRVTVAEEPVRASRERRHGWRTLIVHSRGRGDVTLAFNGKSYAGNPSVAPLATKRALTRAETLIR
ncbi:MAG: hypothetical protein REI09_13010 [Candidatus Dactylopiibacterium sp.]|nr:hypothetical protein [Candidatus Dactylopiibacterium sp.]